MIKENIEIAYFSAEIGLSAELPTYSGGLGVLAGDHIKASADAGLPMLGISLPGSVKKSLLLPYQQVHL